MRKLKKSIKKLESQMNASTAYRQQELFLLKQYLKKPLFISTAIISGVGLGYFLVRKGGIKLMLRALLGTPFFLLRTVNNVRLISPIKKDN